MLLISPEQERLLRIESAREIFWRLCLFYDAEFFNKRPFLKQVAEGFQKIYTGEMKSVSVSMPPRAGKSYITSLYVAWFLGNKPVESFMRNACTSTLYDKFSYDTRAIIRSEKYKEVFPEIELASDKQNLDGWSLKTAKQVSYFGAGTGGTIIGFGASGVAITDDLYKSLEDALSEGTNAKVHRWKESAHDSRLEKNCPSIDIGTRWTTKDVIGKGIEEKKYDLSIVIPALIDDKSFCEDVKTTEEYLDIRAGLPSEIWSGEYMQEPAELEGILFKINELKRFSIADFKPEGMEAIFGYIDVADEGDDALCFVIGKLFKHKIFITDIIFSRSTIDVTAPLCIALIQKENIKFTRVESNNQGGGFIRELRRYISPDKVVGAKSTANKNTRILLEYGFIKQYCYFRNDYEIGSDYDKFIRELCAYMKDGSSKHDDAPDALSGLTKLCQGALPKLFLPDK